MRALVTGGTGFIGTRLISELRRQGWEVVCLDVRRVCSKDAGVMCIEADLQYPDKLAGALEQLPAYEVVFHLAATLPTYQPAPDILQYMVCNTMATVRLLEVAKQQRARAFVYASSLGIIGKPLKLPIAEDHPVRPSNPYFLSKYCGELACELARATGPLVVTSLRITSPYGPGMPQSTVLPRLVLRALRSEKLQWFGSGERTQNFVHVSDVVRAFLQAAGTNRPGVYNVGGPASVSMRELCQLVARTVPGCGSAVGPSETPDPQDDYRWEVDSSRARDYLGYVPGMSIEKGLADYARWLQAGSPLDLWWEPVA
jgi:UDP-glucose 4-epimerase